VGRKLVGVGGALRHAARRGYGHRVGDERGRAPLPDVAPEVPTGTVGGRKDGGAHDHGNARGAGGGRDRKLIENLVWFGIGTSGGLVFAVFFYLIAVALNARDKK
jgi:hypothetical protein